MILELVEIDEGDGKVGSSFVFPKGRFADQENLGGGDGPKGMLPLKRRFAARFEGRRRLLVPSLSLRTGSGGRRRYFFKSLQTIWDESGNLAG